MPTPFSIEGSLKLPPDTGLGLSPIPFVMHGHFSSKADLELTLTGAGSYKVPLGTLGGAGLKTLLIKVDPTTDPTAAPIVVKTNGQAEGEELSPGGVKLHSSPMPRDGIKAITLEHTSNATVKVWALG